MHVAPPPPHALRLQDLGDRLLICVRPRRAWGVIAGHTLALAFLTVFGVVAYIDSGGDLDSTEARLFVCVWLFFAGSQVFGLAWGALGRELLNMTPEHLEVRRELGPFVRIKRYELWLLRKVHAAPVPPDEDELERSDFCLEFTYHTETVRVGQQMTEEEAEYVASATLAWVRPGDDPWRAREQPEAGRKPETGTSGRRAGIQLSSLVFPAVIVVILAVFAYDAMLARRSADAGADADGNAAAATYRALGESGIRVEGGIRCNATSRAQWSCAVPARATTGRDAGVLLTYHCSQGDPDVIHCWTDPTRVTTVASS